LDFREIPALLLASEITALVKNSSAVLNLGAGNFKQALSFSDTNAIILRRKGEDIGRNLKLT
jgi:hypothetical protein